MTATNGQALEAFLWSRQPGAELFLREVVAGFLGRCAFAGKLAARMTEETGTRFYDWIDSVVLPAGAEERLIAVGYREVGREGELRVFRQPEGMFPTVGVTGGASGEMPIRVALKVESVADFLAANEVEVEIEGLPFSPVRRATVARGEGVQLEVVERCGGAGFDAPSEDGVRCLKAAEHLERFRRRERAFESDEAGFDHATELVTAAIEDVGVDQTCALFFTAEREFWQRRNRAAQVQKARQDRLGLGWGNHDHHTYRSSRVHFKRLMGFFELLGIECRERFYAGREAGWGAQVMENARAGIVVFADVDLAPEELLADFAHEPLAARDALGTVGLWCGLHGEAFLEAGMHHLECQFDFEALKQQLEAEHGIAVMKPFTDFPYLRQAFTQGERWPVSERRIGRLLEGRLITPAQADQFRSQGAIGSHLENLERNEGYKGFNQKGVSEIIAATDPRRGMGERGFREGVMRAKS